MSVLSLTLDDDLADLLGDGPLPADQAALELIVMELYRRGKISSGRGAEILQLSRLDFIRAASALGIPYIRLTEAELEQELRTGRSL
jgi:hypothetical protein